MIREIVARLSHSDDAVRIAAIASLAGLRPDEADWDIVVHVARCLERPGECGTAALSRLVDLGDRGADLTAALQMALYRLRNRRPDGSCPALEFLRKAVPLWENGTWKAARLEPYTGTLVDLLVERDPRPEAEVAADLLVLTAARSPDSVSTSLFIRWPDMPGEVFRRLLRRLDPKIVKTAHRVKPDQHPRSVRQAMDGIQDARGPLLVVQGQYSPAPSQAIRVGILEGGRVLSDLWLKSADWDVLVGSLRQRCDVRTGEWDVMYATGWGLAWTSDAGPFEVWNGEGRLAWREGNDFVIRPNLDLPVAAIDHVHAYLREGWVLRGVECVMREGGAICVAEVRDEIPTIDPTYDDLNIACEASWAVSLARAIGRGIGLPVRYDEPL